MLLRRPVACVAVCLVVVALLAPLAVPRKAGAA